MTGNAIVLSIRPKYAEKIFKGIKTVELRRVRPKYITKGTLALVYVSSPVRALVGAFKIDQVIVEPLGDLWKTVRGKACISPAEFDVYFHGASSGVGIFFSELWLLPKPIKLQALKEIMGFQPPQSFRYAKAGELVFPEFAELTGDTRTVAQLGF